MKKFTERRNTQIRERYQSLVKKYKGQGNRKPRESAIADLLKIYSVFELSYETMAKICSDPNYGRPRPTDGDDPEEKVPEFTKASPGESGDNGKKSKIRRFLGMK
jgi:hypothetical protein